MIDYDSVEERLALLIEKMQSDAMYQIDHNGTRYHIEIENVKMWHHFAAIKSPDTDIAWDYIMSGANQIWEQIND
jgi:hypothetical protein